MLVGMSYGSLAMAYGSTVGAVCPLYFVLAGASEFMFIGIVASGGNPLKAAAAAGLLVNARHVPFGVTV